MKKSKTFSGLPLWGPAVRARRAELRLGLRKFCIMAEVDPANFSRYERGVLRPPQDVGTLRRIAAALQLGPESRAHMMDLAALDAGRLPPDIVRNVNALRLMPLIFSGARGKLNRAQLRHLYQRLERELF